MATLVAPVPHTRPGKAQVYLRPEAVALLERATAIYGQPIYPTGSRSGGRTYADQLLLWERHQAGGPVAAHPDRGPRPHMRYGALDIDDESARAAMRAAGWLATEPSEWWHFEHPDARRWPVVTDPILATQKEPTMPTLVALVVGNPPRTNGDYALIGDGAVVGLRAKEDADLINIAKRAMHDREPIYGNQADQLQALFARVAHKPAIDYSRLADEIVDRLGQVATPSAVIDELAGRLTR